MAFVESVLPKALHQSSRDIDGSWLAVLQRHLRWIQMHADHGAMRRVVRRIRHQRYREGQQLLLAQARLYRHPIEEIQGSVGRPLEELPDFPDAQHLERRALGRQHHIRTHPLTACAVRVGKKVLRPPHHDRFQLEGQILDPFFPSGVLIEPHDDSNPLVDRRVLQPKPNRPLPIRGQDGVIGVGLALPPVQIPGLKKPEVVV
ncbi:hypothetical protein CKO23_21550 [Thiocystis violacea]|nr:hypothetical protein [Thiocystis violacea]